MADHHVSWRKSSFSGGNGGDCVEIAALSTGRRGVRDSKLGKESPVLSVPPESMAALLEGIRGGQFD